MRQAKTDPGPADQSPAGEKRCRRRRRLDRHAGAETHSQSGHSGGKVLVAGVDEDQRAEFVGDGEEPVEALVGEFVAANLGGDLDPEEAGAGHAPAQLGDGEVGILQRHRAQGGEPGGVLGDDPGEEVILGFGQFRGAGGVGLVTEGHRDRRDHLEVDTVAVHIGQPGGR